MAGSSSIEGIQSKLESRYRSAGALPVYVLLTTEPLNSSSTAADAIGGEILGMGRAIWTPDASVVTGQSVGFPAKNVVLTNSGPEPVVYNGVAMIYGGSSTGGLVVDSFSGGSVNATGHGFSDDDLVIFTGSGTAPSGIDFSGTGAIAKYYVVNASPNSFQVSATQGGSAIAIGTDGVGEVIARAANGVLDPGFVVTSATVVSGQSATITIDQVRETVA